MKLPFDLKDVKPGSFAYLTKRKLKNKAGKETGEILLWKKKDQEESQYLLKCPFCEAEGEGSALFVKRPYRVKCSHCGRSISLPKLTAQAKKESK
ncbi:MAG: hypothetical protein V3T58_00635 [Candidatus Hydrothermarchaeales archaeon]